MNIKNLLNSDNHWVFLQEESEHKLRGQINISFNCFRRPLKRDDRILIGVFVGLMISMAWYSGVLWHALLGIPVLVSSLWICQPQRLWLKMVHGFLLGIFWMVSVVGLGQWVKAYLLQVYLVPTNSMEQTIIPGDRVLVCKWIYGARRFNAQGSKQLRGTGQVRRGEIVVFHAPEPSDDFAAPAAQTQAEWSARNSGDIPCRTPFVKRCVALPGDIVEVRESVLRVNAIVQQPPATAVFRYLYFFSDSLSTNKAAAWLRGVRESMQVKRFPARNMLETYLTHQQADSLLVPASTEHHLSYSVKPNTIVYPHHDSVLWNLNRWGPMWIPRKGDSILLRHENVNLYAPLIELHEGHRVSWKDSLALVDEVPQRYYVFTQDYYFMMGDNRMESRDSRILGPIPDNHIIGRATHIAWSLRATPDVDNPAVGEVQPPSSPRFRWSRLLKALK